MERIPPVKPLGPQSHLADIALRPLMYVLGGFLQDSVQNTHPWHVLEINPNLVDPELSVMVQGQEERLSKRYGPLFHMFGGWKGYTALVLPESKKPLHIGWVHRKQGEVAQASVNRLSLPSQCVIRALTGPQNTTTQFFAVNSTGEQVKIKYRGQGVLGDNQFPNTMLL